MEQRIIGYCNHQLRRSCNCELYFIWYFYNFLYITHGLYVYHSSNGEPNASSDHWYI